MSIIIRVDVDRLNTNYTNAVMQEVIMNLNLQNVLFVMRMAIFLDNVLIIQWVYILTEELAGILYSFNINSL